MLALLPLVETLLPKDLANEVRESMVMMMLMMMTTRAADDDDCSSRGMQGVKHSQPGMFVCMYERGLCGM